MTQPRMRVSASVLGAPDARALADFYQQLLGWKRLDDEPGWVRLQPPAGGTGLSFQHEAEYVRPVWPPAPGAQQMMAHLDIAVEDLDAAVAWAEAAGAVRAEFQRQPHVRVMLDPAGHPFCLFHGSV
jgi:catechol 2,3-dioxygenase-like lactoylglutathione lyase family enzyme